MQASAFLPRLQRQFSLALVCFLFALLGACASAPPKPTLGQRQVETLTHLGFSKTDDGWLLVLPDRISFEFGKDDLKPEFSKAIADFASQLLAVDIRQLRVDGYTDNVGARDYNLGLSQRRANIVADTFVANGFATKDIERKGLGPDHPAADNGTPDGRAKNRRVELIVASSTLATP
ncbi:OmpA family protein [Rudaea sp.]|uniref:OmpA family protein n=1 Tax=Rudaea sp. TaxID=2136325 RepID=UPI002ED3F7AD